MFFNVLKYKKFCYICLFIVFILFCYLIYKNNNNITNNNLPSITNKKLNEQEKIDLNENFKNKKFDKDEDEDEDEDEDDYEDIDYLNKYIDEKKKFKNKNKDIVIVMARYNEDISYLNNKEFSNKLIYLYNKGEDIIDEKILSNENIKIIKLPNVGKCDHTYLYHIINNYNDLANITIFLPASFYYMNFKKYKGIKILKDTDEKRKSIFPVEKLRKTNYENIYHFTEVYFKTRFKVNQINVKNFKTKLSPIRPYGKWFESLFDKNKYKSFYKCDYVIYYGMFSVSKDKLLKYNLDFYKKLISFVDDDVNPEAGHYIERIWACMFYPFTDSYLMAINSGFNYKKTIKKF